MEFQGTYKSDGFNFGDNREKVLKHCKFNVGRRFILSDFLPESRHQRKFFHGAVIALWVYLDGHDYKDAVLLNQYFEHAKREFNPVMVVINNKPTVVGGSTKGKLNEGIIEKTIDYLVENYAVNRIEVLDPKKYEDWRDRVSINRSEIDYIDYLSAIGKLPKLSP